MDYELIIVEALRANDIALLSKIVSSASADPLYFAAVVVDRDSAGKQVPSNRTLRQIQENLLSQGVRVEFLLRYEKSEEIEGGLRATLLHSHIEHIRNVFVSFESGEAHIWIEPKHALESATINQMVERAEKFLSLFEVVLAGTSITSDEVLPTKLGILTAIRLLAPASLTSLAIELTRRGFKVPSPDWLHRRLDVLRKEGSLVRLAGGELVLTRHSLHVLGTTKNRGSPDISRLLALARRGS